MTDVSLSFSGHGAAVNLHPGGRDLESFLSVTQDEEGSVCTCQDQGHESSPLTLPRDLSRGAGMGPPHLLIMVSPKGPF